MTAIRQEAMELLERIPEDKLTYGVQIMRGVDGLISISGKEKNIDLDQFVMQTTERARNADEYVREMRDGGQMINS